MSRRDEPDESEGRDRRGERNRDDRGDRDGHDRDSDPDRDDDWRPGDSLKEYWWNPISE
jgi:hypothetical protein